MIENWLVVEGNYVWRTGNSLLDLDSRTLFATGYAAMEERALVDKELIDARNSFQGRFRDMVLEETTGIPAAVRQFAGFDASQMMGGGDK